MAPLDDDFILTISDNEDVSDYEEAEVIDRPLKRKRDTADAPANGASKKSKKAAKKAAQNAPKPTDPSPAAPEDEPKDWAAEGEDDGALDPDFEFVVGDGAATIMDDFDGWGLGEQDSGKKKAANLDEIIARRRKAKGEKVDSGVDGVSGEDEEEVEDEDVGDFAGFGEDDELLADDAFGMGAVDEAAGDDEEDDEGSEDEAQDEEDSDAESVADSAPDAMDLEHPASESDTEDEEAEDPLEAERRAAFFAPEENIEGERAPLKKGSGSFQAMDLSRPLLKGLAAVGFSEPTPIQHKTIPIALAGKDVVGGAVTGSGKTGAFIIPILQRLLLRNKKVPRTRVAVLMPTRELAVQCFNVAKKIAMYTDITFAQIVGGFSLREQEQVLKTRPDVIIATPGRFIDHMRNSPSFAVDTLEILVLDEADRMLEDGFADELNEILTTIPKSRQTMLFSATMTDSVDKLIRVGLNRPVRLLVDAKRQTVSGLVQEFARLRPGKEGKRLAYLLYLCTELYTNRVIIFFRQKKEAHRVRIVFGLCGLKAAELHGSMTQEQRIQAVENFRSSKVSFLLATDLASRGLDIKGVETVINYEAPQTHEIYLHRVGRTARAGRTGRACTIAAESDRKVVKAAVKAARAQGAKVVPRKTEGDKVDEWEAKLAGMEDEVEDIMREEKEEKVMAQAEMQVRKGENIISHEDEIMARPKRTWFESAKEKDQARAKGFAELNGPGGKKEKGKGGKLSGKQRKKLEARDITVKGEGRVWKKTKSERGSQLPTQKKQASKSAAREKGAPRDKSAKKAANKGRRR